LQYGACILTAKLKTKLVDDPRRYGARQTRIEGIDPDKVVTKIRQTDIHYGRCLESIEACRANIVVRHGQGVSPIDHPIDLREKYSLVLPTGCCSSQRSQKTEGCVCLCLRYTPGTERVTRGTTVVTGWSVCRYRYRVERSRNLRSSNSGEITLLLIKVK